MHNATHREGGGAEATKASVHNALLLLKSRLLARKPTGYHRRDMTVGGIQSILFTLVSGLRSQIHQSQTQLRHYLEAIFASINSAGQKRVKADWIRLIPTNPANASQ
jgi:hypothetical protein